MAKMKISKTHSETSQQVDSYVGPTQVTSSGTTDYPGAVGGVVAQAGPQIHPQVCIDGAEGREGSILLMKGAHKHYVLDDLGNKGQCTLVNKGWSDLVAGEMSITVTTATTTFYASKITNKFVWDFSTPPKKYRYWHNATATTSNEYSVDSAAGTTGFVSVPDAS